MTGLSIPDRAADPANCDDARGAYPSQSVAGERTAAEVGQLPVAGLFGVLRLASPVMS